MNTNENDKVVSVSMRDVNKETWRDFKKLACIYDMTMQEYLMFLIEREMAKIQIIKK